MQFNLTKTEAQDGDSLEKFKKPIDTIFLNLLGQN